MPYFKAMAGAIFKMHFLPGKRLEAIKEVFSKFPVIEKAFLLGTLCYNSFQQAASHEIIVFGHPDEATFLQTMEANFKGAQPDECYEFTFADELDDLTLAHILETGVLIYVRRKLSFASL